MKQYFSVSSLGAGAFGKGEGRQRRAGRGAQAQRDFPPTPFAVVGLLSVP